MAIKLLKPLGTDIYDVDIFNYNATVIEEYLNKLVAGDEISLKIYYYPKDSTTFNIDTCGTGIHVCDGMLFDNLSGTFPEASSRDDFEVMSLGDETGYSTVQLMFDMSDTTKYITYFRAKLPNSDVWSSWVKIATGSGSTSEGLQIIYTDEINVDEVTTAIYMCANATVTGIMPAELVDKSLFQLTSYGDDDNGPKTQTLIDLKHDVGTQYTRYKRQLSTGEWAWTQWEKQLNYEEFKDGFIAKNNGVGTGTTTLENLNVTKITETSGTSLFGTTPESVGPANATTQFVLDLVNNNIKLNRITKISSDVTTNETHLLIGTEYEGEDASYARTVITALNDRGIKISRPQTDYDASEDIDIPNLASVKALLNSLDSYVRKTGDVITSYATSQGTDDAKSGNLIFANDRYPDVGLGFGYHVTDDGKILCIVDYSKSGDNILLPFIDVDTTITNGIKIHNVHTPEKDYDAATKKYVDDAVSGGGGGGGFLPLSGGTMTGTLDMGSKTIINLATPTLDSHAATKKYVDDAITSAGNVQVEVVDI